MDITQSQILSLANAVLLDMAKQHQKTKEEEKTNDYQRKKFNCER